MFYYKFGKEFASNEVFCRRCGTWKRPKQKNVLCSSSEERSAIEHYFERGFRYNTIVQFLEKYHDISMNLRTLKRRLREYGLRNRTEVHSVHEVREIVKHEIEGSPSLLGYPSGRIIEIGAYLQPNLVSIAMNVPFPWRKLHRLCEYTLIINFKCQSLRSNVTTVQTKHCKV